MSGDLLNRCKSALLAAEPHRLRGKWKENSRTDKKINKYIEIAHLDLQFRDNRGRVLNEREKAKQMCVTRSHWHSKHEYFYQIVRQVLMKDDRKQFFATLR